MGQKSKQRQLAPGVGAIWARNVPVFAFGDGTLLIGEKAYHPHQGGILALAFEPISGLILTCGDDGNVVGTDLQGVSGKLLSSPNTWLDMMVCHATSQTIAANAGRIVLVFRSVGTVSEPIAIKPLRAATSLAFSGNGDLLAVGHSAGVSLFKIAQPDEVWREFPCSGGPLSVALDETGDFLFAGLSEPALAGWRLADGQGFRMGGYPGKPRQLVWSSNGKALLTTGGPALLVWPMTSNDGRTITGPMGQAAGVYRPRLGLLTAVATNGDHAATGWSDGGVDLVNLFDGTTRHVGGPRPPNDLEKDPRALTSNIISIALRDDGKQVSWVSETGSYGTAAVQ